MEEMNKMTPPYEITVALGCYDRKKYISDLKAFKALAAQLGYDREWPTSWSEQLAEGHLTRQEFDRANFIVNLLSEEKNGDLPDFEIYRLGEGKGFTAQSLHALMVKLGVELEPSANGKFMHVSLPLN
jgi:hypothetical protein